MYADDQIKRLDIVRRFFTGTGASYDRVVNICTLGMDGLWKKKILNMVPPHAGDILDLACGTGILTFKLASAFPSARILGIDITPEYLEIAIAKAEHLHFSNTRFIIHRAEEVLLDKRFDCIVSSYLAKYADLRILVPHAAQMLQNGGTFIMHDFTYPQNRASARLWDLYLKILYTVGRRRYPEWTAAFEGLPDLLRRTNWIEELRPLLHEHGFSHITIDQLIFGTAAAVKAVKV